MISDALSNTLELIEEYQKNHHDSYDCIEHELNSLKLHMALMIAYLEPLSEEDLEFSIPETLEKHLGGYIKW
jgi:hypothetical protein